MRASEEKVLEFDIVSGLVNLSDPCYDTATWCGKYNIPAQNGKWLGSVVLWDEGSWGHRVAELWAHHVDHPGYTGEQIDTDFGVDSGQFGIFDVSIYNSEDKEDGSFSEFYDACCTATLGPDYPKVIQQYDTVMGKGIVSSTGYGDGSYICYGRYNEAGELVSVRAVFLDDSEEEEEEEEYDNYYNDLSDADDCAIMLEGEEEYA